MPFNLPLRFLNCIVDHSMLDRLAIFESDRLHDSADPVACEYPHEVVFHRQVEACRPRVSLAAGTAPELVVDPS